MVAQTTPAHLDRKGERASGPIGMSKTYPPGLAPATALQQSLWFWQQASPGSGIYNLAQCISLDEPPFTPLDRAILTQALELLVRRHQALRVVLATEGDSVVLREERGAVPRLAERDLTDEADAQAALSALAAQELNSPFDLAAGPLTRLTLAWLPGEGASLVKCSYHAVSDGISEQVFCEELGRVYAALIRGDEPDLGPEPMQIAEFARRQAQLVASARGRELRVGLG